ncbi:hypothetical protein C8J57DRAFT_1407992 [Mycena rebaudengoi]|nr:hypothetical protein C8J57DRAFT_1407992 [Mycena rebaudengoi]
MAVVEGIAVVDGLLLWLYPFLNWRQVWAQNIKRALPWASFFLWRGGDLRESGVSVCASSRPPVDRLMSYFLYAALLFALAVGVVSCGDAAVGRIFGV